VADARVDEAALAAWGREFAGALTPPVVIALSGDLGTGKTTLVRAIAAGFGAEGSVTSPTFALVHRHRGARATVYHVDAYRLRPSDDVRDLGFAEMLDDPAAVVVVEWPERLGGSAPPFTHHIRLAYAEDPGARLVRLA